MSLHTVYQDYEVDGDGRALSPRVLFNRNLPVEDGTRICSCCGAIAYTEDTQHLDKTDYYATLDNYVGIKAPWPGIIIADGKVGEEEDDQYTINHINCKAGVLTVSIQNWYHGDWKDGLRPEEDEEDYDNPF
jgi:hypothetical protein